MSDDTGDSGDEGGGKRGKNGARDKILVEPVVKDQALFEFLELLFYDEPEPAHFPERIEVNVVKGRHKEQLTSVVLSLPFAPVNASGEAIKRGVGQSKPTREKLVALSNRILHAMQRDCDESRVKQCYGVHAWCHSRGDDPYARCLKHCEPKGKYPQEGQEDEEALSLEQRHSTQVLGHHERMFNMYAATHEGMLDRFDRLLEKAYDRIEKQDATIQKQADMLERSLSMEAERKERLEMVKLKTKAAEKGLEFALSMMPPIVNQLMGKQIAPTQDTAETITLKNFLKLADDGGSLTKEQADAAFGIWDDSSEHNLLVPGVLSRDQVLIILSVAGGHVSPDELDKIIPGGVHGITMQQAAALQKIFTLDQLAPVMMLFETRQKNKAGR